jgi:hypothetical protein
MPPPSPTACARPSGPAASARSAVRRPAPPTSATAASRWNRPHTRRAYRANALRCAGPTESHVDTHGWRPTADPAHPCAASAQETMTPAPPQQSLSLLHRRSSSPNPPHPKVTLLETVPIYATTSRNSRPDITCFFGRRPSNPVESSPKEPQALDQDPLGCS